MSWSPRASRPPRARKTLLVEQNVGFCLELADRVYVLEKGHIRYHGSAREFREDKSIRHQYLAL